ncbi:MAG: 50S ribosomal protein L37ae [Candidatus Micrarchaeia archaeon]
MAKWNVRHGASLRKRYLAVLEQKRDTYVCSVCGKKAVKRISTGIWQCKHCGATFAGGAFTPSTEAGKAVERIISRLAEGAAAQAAEAK